MPEINSYNLNLTKTYCNHWTLGNALRELIANTIDEDGEITIEPILDENGNVTDHVNIVLETQRELTIDSFAMGYTNKTNKESIGRFGEGLKIALLILKRLDYTFSICSGDKQFMFEFLVTPGFTEPTLHLQIVQNKHINGTRIIVEEIDEDEILDVYINKPFGILPGQPGLYCKGLLVEEDWSIRVERENYNVYYGINLDYNIKTNRDRDYITDKKIIAPVIEQYFEPKDMINVFYTESVMDLYKSFTDEYAQQVAKAYLVQEENWTLDLLENVRVIFRNCNNSRLRYAYKEGILIPINYWWLGSLLWRKDDYLTFKQLEISTSTDAALSEFEENQITDIAVDALYCIIKNAKNINMLLNGLLNLIIVPIDAKEEALKSILELDFITNKPVEE